MFSLFYFTSSIVSIEFFFFFFPGCIELALSRFLYTLGVKYVKGRVGGLYLLFIYLSGINWDFVVGVVGIGRVSYDKYSKGGCLV